MVVSFPSVTGWVLTIVLTSTPLKISGAQFWTKTPGDPFIVVDGVNNTNVDLVWEYSEPEARIVNVVITRKRQDRTTDEITIASRLGEGSGTATDYSVPANLRRKYNLRQPATLQLLNVKDGDEYVYIIRVNYLNARGIPVIRVHSVFVDVKVPPRMITLPARKIRNGIGSNLTLTCEVSGDPLPNIIWTREGATTNQLVNATGSVLNLVRIQLNDAGSYRCMADNGYGVVSSLASVNIICSSHCKTTTVLLRLLQGIGWTDALRTRGSLQFENLASNLTAAISSPYSRPENEGKRPYYINIKEFSLRSGIFQAIVDLQFSSGLIDPLQPLHVDIANGELGPFTVDTQLVVNPNETTTATPTSTGKPTNQVYADLTIMEDFLSEYRDLSNQVSKQLVDSFVSEMDKAYQNDDNYVRTEVTGLRTGSVIVSFTIYFKNAVIPSEGISNFEAAISDGTFGTYQVGHLTLLSPGTSTLTSTPPRSSQPTEFQCACDTTLLVIIGVLVAIIIVLILVIAWQHRKLGIARKKRPYKVAEDKDRRIYDNEVAMEELSPTNDPPSSSYQQLSIPIEPADMPLQGTTHYDVGPSGPNNSARNVEYTPLDIRKGSWEVTRKDVKVEKIVGKGAFGQVAKGTAKNLPFHSGTTTVAVKMLKANAPASDKRDLKSELELMKTLKPHPHVIKLLGCVTETDPLLVLIEYVPYGDLLGYLRKSRGLNDTYYKDPDIKPQTSLTSQQLMKFAWQIADGMSYLSLRKIIHRDLAARNVLVGETETCKVTDFGMARDVQQENIYERKTRGRLPVKWTAYESLLYGKYTTKSDVWSYGVLLYEICTVGGSPYPRMDGKKLQICFSKVTECQTTTR
ncbi:fibroblast growth factor receptor-like [Montipora foliosa]|uniref:fibroblast growth factor receptor-like n=1 Tax=Montipora foliosa TaxID=591990 RepID=UPI0035F15D4B